MGECVANDQVLARMYAKWRIEFVDYFDIVVLICQKCHQ